MPRQCFAILLTIAISVSALGNHCEDVEHVQKHMDGLTASSGLAFSSPEATHEEPCDHCAFCTGGVEEATSLLIESSPVAEAHGWATSLAVRSIVSPTTRRPPRS